MTWKQLTERDCREWKLSASDPHDRDTWRSGARSAMPAASQLPGRLWILPLYVHLNKKSHDDDLCFACEAEARPGLEKSSVLPVLDRFLNHKTDFVLNRTQKNWSIKICLFPSNS